MERSRFAEWFVLALIIVAALALRLSLSLQSPYFTSPESYDHLRQVEHVRDTGKLLLFDPLSNGGVSHILSPLFYYVMALFWYLFPSPFVLKIVPNLFACLGVFMVFLIVRHLTRNPYASLVGAMLAAFLPSYVEYTFNDLSFISLAAPLMLFLMYCLMRLREGYYLYAFLFGIMLFTVLSPLVFVFCLGFLGYLVILRTENYTDLRMESELLVFSVFLVLWTQFLLYKKAFLLHGLGVVYQNVPVLILSSYFEDFSVFGVIARVGLIPFLIGLFMLYKYTLRVRDRALALIISFGLLSFVLLWLKLVTVQVGLVMLGLLLAVLVGKWYDLVGVFLERSRLAHRKVLLELLIVVLLLVSTAVPTVIYAHRSLQSQPGPDFISAMRWLKANTNEDMIIFASPQDSSMITYFTGRPNMVDMQFLMVHDIESRWRDAQSLVTSPFQSKAVEVINAYGIDYLFISDGLLRLYGVDSIEYLDSPCMKVVYDGPYRIVDVRSCVWIRSGDQV